MQKVCITPFDESSALRVDSLKLWVECRAKGVETRRLFIEKMLDMFPVLNEQTGLKQLEHFWSNRYFDEDFNIKVCQMLNNVKLD